MKRTNSYLWFINICTLIVLGVCYVIPYTNAGYAWVLGMVGVLFPFWVSVNFLFIVYWGINQRWVKAGVGGIVILFGWSHIRHTYQLNAEGVEERSPAITILSYNVRALNFYNWRQNREEQRKFYQQIQNIKPDVLCLQEFFTMPGTHYSNWDTLHQLSFFQEGHFKPEIVVQRKRGAQQFGMAQLSRFPILKTGDVRYQSDQIAVYTDLQVDTHRIRVYNVHLRSFNFKDQELKNLEGGKFDWPSTLQIVRKFKQSHQIRGRQARVLAQKIQECPYPVIVCGDFNATPVSYTYHQLSQLDKVKDVFLEAGKGIGATYVGRIPFLRIDYIFRDTSLQVTDFKIVHPSYSDHYPLQLTFTPKESL